MQNKVPVLFIVFNRPETTEKVFKAIQQYKPTKLFVAADGPREDKVNEKEKCKETRKITEKIDWPCEVQRLYRDKNLGCRHAVSGAIDWFFENVEEGIILEDDCLPDSSFFNYCQTLLKKYRNNFKVMHIGGDNFQNGIHRGEKGASYYFSKFPHIWGWATWRRAWNRYSLKMDVKDNKFKKIFRKMNLFEKVYWGSSFWCVNHNLVDTWDYQWLFTCWKQDGLAILPNKNLVVNIGFGDFATNTKRGSNYMKNIKLNKMTLINDPRQITVDLEADRYTSDNVFGANSKHFFKNLLLVPWFFYRSAILSAISKKV